MKKADILAGLSVAIVLIPQALAYAELAGLPSSVGLYSASVPLIAAAFFASSRYLQTGPVAMTALLTYGVLTSIAVAGSDEYVRLAVVLALVVGATRLILGYMKAGVVAYLMSQPVLLGFTTAAAILIILSQFPTAVGVEADGATILRRAFQTLGSVTGWNYVTVTLSLCTATILLGGRRLHKLFPGALLVVAGGVVFSRWTAYSGTVLGEMPAGLPPFSFALEWASVPTLFMPGVVIALVGFAEPASIARTYAAMDRERWDPSREFVGQGVANIVAAFSGGMPVGGSFARTGVARLSGGETRMTGLVAGVAVLFFLPFSAIIAPLPNAVLATIVICAVARLVRVGEMVRMIRITWGQSLVAWCTFVITIAAAPRIDVGVVTGVILAALVHMRREARVRVAASVQDGRLLLKPEGVLYYGSAPQLSQALINELATHEKIDRVVVDLRELGRIDYSGIRVLHDFIQDCDNLGLKAKIRSIPSHARGTMHRFWGDTLTDLIEASPELRP